MSANLNFDVEMSTADRRALALDLMNDMMTVGTKNGNDPDFHEFTRLIPVEEHATVNKHINEFVEAFETKKCLAF